jgi:hypothetical protein
MKKIKKLTHPDFSQIAYAVVQAATDESDQAEETESPQATGGRIGGKKGGPARASKLTPEQRSEIAKKAAQARWKK